jgi:hypothetical protein
MKCGQFFLPEKISAQPQAMFDRIRFLWTSALIAGLKLSFTDVTYRSAQSVLRARSGSPRLALGLIRLQVP